MKLITSVWLVLVATLIAAPAQAQTARQGPFVAIAVGEAQYNYDCYFFSDCNNAHATPTKIGAGYRFGGVFGLETWYSDFGQGSIQQGRNTLRVNSLAVMGAWHMRFGETVQGVLRAGGARVTQTRTDDDRSRTFEGAFGLGLLVDVTPAVAIEMAWDITTSTGQNTGSTVVNAVTAGLRLRF